MPVARNEWFPTLVLNPQARAVRRTCDMATLRSPRFAVQTRGAQFGAENVRFKVPGRILDTSEGVYSIAWPK
jgi:hypothetical protein